LRYQSSDLFYHVMSRGNGKQDIFLCPGDRTYFLKVLQQVVLEEHWICHAYCLMSNHYHLLIETRDPNLAEGMQYLNGVFSIAFNKRHKRVGHVMQGRYASCVINNDDYFVTVIRYMARNPLDAGFCKAPADWRWSSYGALLGEKAPWFPFNCAFTLEMFSNDRDSARRLLRKLVEETADTDLPIPYEDLGELEAALEGNRELSRGRRPSLSELLEGTRKGRERDSKIVLSHDKAGYTMSEIAEFLGLHRTSVSKAIARSSKIATCLVPHLGIHLLGLTPKVKY
jgi:putative transposase